MDFGFETIGNATLICHDQQPILATDPWIVGNAYFGSWTLTHEIPQEQLEAVKQCKYIWVSHGHPDHLSLESLAALKDKPLLVPHHAGGRIAGDLSRLGYKVVVLEDRKWTALSPRIHVLCIADYNQDGLLLIDMDGILLVNLNDGGARGWESFLKATIKQYKQSFLLKLFTTFSDADMINFMDEEGRRIEPTATDRHPVGRSIQRYAEKLGVTNVIPFSSLHKYQRRDSVWANQYITALNDYAAGFASSRCTLFPAFISYDCRKDDCREIRPAETPNIVVDPRACGDDWDEPLDHADVNTITGYFRSIAHLEKLLDFINVRVGGQDNVIELRRKANSRSKRGLRFEAPRQSFMQAIEHECFDDLLIGNFMRTCLIGDWPCSGLYPEFTPYVAKYADNGRAKTHKELREYFAIYRERAPRLNYLRHCLMSWATNQASAHLSRGSALFYAAKTVHEWVKT